MRRGEHFYAHRVAYEVQRGPIPVGLFVCHHCDNPPCCNGRHLFVGTTTDNMRDMWKKQRGFTPFAGRHLIGEDHHSAKLDAAKVAAIREMRSRGMLLEEIGMVVGVGKSTVSRVINRDVVGGWTHV